MTCPGPDLPELVLTSATSQLQKGTRAQGNGACAAPLPDLGKDLLARWGLSKPLFYRACPNLPYVPYLFFIL